MDEEDIKIIKKDEENYEIEEKVKKTVNIMHLFKEKVRLELEVKRLERTLESMRLRLNKIKDILPAEAESDTFLIDLNKKHKNDIPGIQPKTPQG